MTDKELKEKYDKPMDDYERKVMESLENDEWQPVQGKRKDDLMAKMREAAKNTVGKRRIKKAYSIRLFIDDVDKIREEAALEGIPYQTLIGSILHKYVLKRSAETA